MRTCGYILADGHKFLLVNPLRHLLYRQQSFGALHRTIVRFKTTSTNLLSTELLCELILLRNTRSFVFQVRWDVVFNKATQAAWPSIINFEKNPDNICQA